MAAGDWDAALEALDAAGEDDRRSPEGLELLASAAYGHGDLERTLGAWEDLHRERGTRRSTAGGGGHLAVTLRSGTYCAYEPDTRLPTTWETRPRPETPAGVDAAGYPSSERA